LKEMKDSKENPPVSLMSFKEFLEKVPPGKLGQRAHLNRKLRFQAC